MTLSTPVYLHSVWRGSRALTELWHREAESLNLTVEKHLDSAFSEIEPMLAREQNEFRLSVDVNVPTKIPSGVLSESERRRQSTGTATLARVRLELSRIATNFGLRTQSGYSRSPTEASKNPTMPRTPIGSSIPEAGADQNSAASQPRREADQPDASPLKRELFPDLIPDAAPVGMVSDGHTMRL